jgi:hypothetical protein
MFEEFSNHAALMVAAVVTLLCAGCDSRASGASTVPMAAATTAAASAWLPAIPVMPAPQPPFDEIEITPTETAGAPRSF